MGLIILKEFSDLTRSPKFLVSLLVTFILILFSLFKGYSSYQDNLESADKARHNYLEKMKEAETYSSALFARNYISYSPDKMSILVRGVKGYLGNRAFLEFGDRIEFGSSEFSENPHKALSGLLDIPFIVVYILSVFAILFSYNMINGEKEAGTLKLILSNNIPRYSVVAGKIIGGVLPLILVFTFSLISGLTILTIFTDVSFSFDDLIYISIFIIISVLFLFVFYLIGFFASTLTHHSKTSFLISLFLWILFIFILPKVIVRISEVTTQRMTSIEFDALEEDYSHNYADRVTAIRTSLYNKAKIRSYDKQTNDKRNIIRFRCTLTQLKHSDRFNSLLKQEYNNGLIRVINNTRNLGYLSPLIPFTLLSLDISNSSLEDQVNLEKQLEDYKTHTNTFLFSKALTPLFDEQPKVDDSWVTAFKPVNRTISDYFDNLLLNAVFLIGYVFLLFLFSIIAFNRYDVR